MPYVTPEPETEKIPWWHPTTPTRVTTTSNLRSRFLLALRRREAAIFAALNEVPLKRSTDVVG